MTDRKQTPADRIKILIGKASKQDFAKKAGIARGSLSRLLAGAPLSRSSAEKLARVGGVTIDWLLTGSDEPRVSETPAPYGGLDRAARRAQAEFLDFWKTANDAKKQHLLKQMRWLRAAQELEEEKKKD